MKTITFPDIAPATADQLKWAEHNTLSGNGLYDALYKAYSYHIPITIRPDDILNNIACIWAKYVIINAERFRSFFSTHQGKKKLTYVSDGSYSDERMSEFMAGLMELIIADQGDSKVLWAVGDTFTTSLDSDLFVRAVATLASQKEYYQYNVRLRCGIPSITLEGTLQDWEILQHTIKHMPIPMEDPQLLAWKQRLAHLVSEMINNESADFWQTVVTRERGGSGPSTIEGWIVNFNPFNEVGDWHTTMDKKDMLNLLTDFDVTVDDNGTVFELNVSAGPCSVQIDNGSIAVVNTQRIKIKE